MVNLLIDNIAVQAREDSTILAAARDAGRAIPSLCQDDRFPPHGSCGLCIVEVEGDKRLLRACATPVAEGMKVFTSSARVITARRQLLELLLSAHKGDCVAPCRLACPAESDCQGYIGLIAQGRYEDAYKRMMEAHPFPASIGRVCPRPCEAKCRRGLVDQPVNIAGLKRFGADWATKAKEVQNTSENDNNHTNIYVPKIQPDSGMSVAIVGGGPSGLTAAYFLRRAGHGVAVYDRMPKMGGLLRYGIPEYRLPKAVLDRETEVLTRMGIEFHNKISIGDGLPLSHLQEQYDAVIVASGAGESRLMNIPGEDLPGVIGGIAFLRNVAEKGEQERVDASPSADSCPASNHVKNNSGWIALNNKNVVVIGGSNTAIDAARTALRIGAKSVIIAYRRTKDEMPADLDEISEAMDEGVLFKFLVAPIEITADNKQANGIRLQKMTTVAHDTDGRRGSEPIPGQEEWLDADAIIVAIGQAVDLNGLTALGNTKSVISADSVTFETNQKGVYAIGDATGQSAYAIEAIGHGRKAAAAVHEYLTGIAIPPWEILPHVLVNEEKTSTDFSHLSKASRVNNQKKEAAMGFLQNFDEVHLDLSKAEATTEANRCLSCGCGDYNECKLIPLSNEYNSNPKKYLDPKKPNWPLDYSNPLYTYDPNKCVHCGLCVKACKQGVLTMASRGYTTVVAAPFNENCVHCGDCKAICPVGARA